LILVERDPKQLDLLEEAIRQSNPLQQTRITKIGIDKFDQDSMWRAFGGNRDVKAH
jgi:hypothetical protein